MKQSKSVISLLFLALDSAKGQVGIDALPAYTSAVDFSGGNTTGCY